MINEFELFKKMLLNGEISGRDLGNIFINNKFKEEEIVDLLFSSNSIKYLAYMYPILYSKYQDKYNKLIENYPHKIELILAIYEIDNVNFPITKYLDLIIKEGTDEDNYKLANLIVASNISIDIVNKTLEQIFEMHKDIYERFKFQILIKEFKNKDIKEFVDILVEKNLLSYFISHLEIENYKDLEMLYYFLKDNNLDDNIKIRLRNKFIEFKKLDSKGYFPLKRICMEIGLIEFINVLGDSLNILEILKKMIFKIMCNNYLDNELILRVYYDYFDGNIPFDKEKDLDTEYKNLINMDTKVENGKNKVYQKVSNKLWRKLLT